MQRTPGKVAPDVETRPPLKLREDGGPTAARANIISPKCLHGTGNGSSAQRFRGSRKDTNPLDPQNATRSLDCGNEELKRVIRVANTPWPSPTSRCSTTLRWSRLIPSSAMCRSCASGTARSGINRPAPLAISSEDPGTQLINYRNEPVPLRVSNSRSRPTRSWAASTTASSLASRGKRIARARWLTSSARGPAARSGAGAQRLRRSTPACHSQPAGGDSGGRQARWRADGCRGLAQAVQLRAICQCRPGPLPDHRARALAPARRPGDADPAGLRERRPSLRTADSTHRRPSTYLP